MGTPEAFLSNFKQLFKSFGGSQNQFAIKCGLSQSQVTNYLAGNNSPSLENLDRIAAAFGVSVNELLSSDSPVSPRIERPSIPETLKDDIATIARQAAQEAIRAYQEAQEPKPSVKESELTGLEGLPEILASLNENQRRRALQMARQAVEKVAEVARRSGSDDVQDITKESG